MTQPPSDPSTQPAAQDARNDLRHRQTYRITTQPLIVTPTFVSRVDTTPRVQRPLDKGFSLDREGDALAEPSAAKEPPAIEADPNLAWEHWDEYWRKVHGPKFAYEEPGGTMEPVVRYDELHRLPSGPSSFFKPPYRAMVQEDGKLVTDAYAKVPSYGRPKWDGLAYIAYESEEAMKKLLGQNKYTQRVVADEETAFRVVTRNYAREYILPPSALHRDPISLVKIHQRHARLSREEFQRRWLDEHAELVLSKPATHLYVRRYAQLHYLGSTQEDPEGSRMDGISVLSFASVNDVEDYLTHADHAAIEVSESALSDAVGSSGGRPSTSVSSTAFCRSLRPSGEHVPSR